MSSVGFDFDIMKLIQEKRIEPKNTLGLSVVKPDSKPFESSKKSNAACVFVSEVVFVVVILKKYS
jgi:hypothetical protein